MPKNILLIIVDQLIQDCIEVYNGPCQTPALNRLSEQGITFDNAYTPVSLCSPARASMLTGKLPHKHGILYNVTTEKYGHAELQDGEKVIPDFLSKEGYKCGYAGKWHIGEDKGPDKYGFEGTKHPGYGIPSDFVEDYDDFLKENGHPGMRSVELKNVLGEAGELESIFMPTAESFKEAGKGGGLYDGTIDLPTELTPAGFVAGKTIELLREFNENPFFLVSSFWGPHHPSLPSPEFAGTHDPDSIGEWKNYRDELAEKPRIQKRYRDQLHRYLTDAPWEIWQKIIAGHFDFMSMIDQQIGRILDELQKLGQEEDTLIIFVADHGDTLGCHGGQWDKGPYMYEETYRIPMIIRPPRPREATRNSSLVSNMDLFSTVLDFCGVQPPSNVDSRSLIPIIEGNKEAIRESVLGQFYGFDKRGMNFQRMLRKGDYKYVYNPSDIDELYDLESDPHELANLINRSEKQEFASDMKQTLYEEMKKSGDPFADEACHLMGLSH